MTDDRTPPASGSGGCPVAHGEGTTRLYGPGAATDPHAIYARLRGEHGAVAPVLLEGDVPAWLVLGYRRTGGCWTTRSSSAETRGAGGTSWTAASRPRRR